MKESIKKRINVSEIGWKELVFEIIRQAIVGGIAAIVSLAGVFGQMRPFGLAFVAAVPSEYLAMASFGSFIGYLFPLSTVSGLKYFAALFAIISIKALISAITKIGSKPIFSSAICSLVTLITGLVASKTSTEMALAVAECVISAGGAYFFNRSVRLLFKKTAGLRGQELAAVLISVNLLFMGFMSIAPANISLGRILSVAFILIASRYGQTEAGAISGVVAGFCAAMVEGGAAALPVFAFGGLMAGIFASNGKYIQIGVYLISAAVAATLGGDFTATVGLIIEACFGAAVSLCIPKGGAVKVGRMFSPPVKTVSENGMKKSVTMRLKYAASALSDVSQTVENVARELGRINSPDFDTVISNIEKESCGGCTLRVHCWEQKKSETVSAVLDMIKGIKEGKDDIIEDSPEEFRGRCIRSAKMGQSVFRYYSDYASRIAAESRLSDVRNIVSDQFGGISDMLTDLAAELNRDETFDDVTAAKIAMALKNIDIRAEECGCRIDKYGRMSVEIIAKPTERIRYSRMQILRSVEACCDRDFEPPVINQVEKSVYITLTEKAVISADIGISQHACSPSGICGDAYSHFNDGEGRVFMVLSDGMGAGGRAAVDGAMASGLMSRLLKAGFGYDCSLSIVNSAMLFKSTDESLATVDISCVDLFSGRCDLLKAGAAPTIIRRNGKCGRAQSTSLPAGILREVGFDKATVKLYPGDVVVMVSDGAVSEGTEWLCAEIESWRDGNAQSLAEHLMKCARRRRSDNHDDDITVMAAMIERAV